MELLTVSLLGKCHIQYREKEIVDLYGGKLQEMLGYLLVHRKKAFTREYLGCLFWPDALAAQSKRYLSKTLWQLQSILSKHLGELQEPLVYADTEWIQINPAFPLWLDVAVLEDAFHIVEMDMENVPMASQIVELSQAVSVYHGDLLDGWYYGWCLTERERFRYMLLMLLDILMSSCEKQSDYGKGIHYGRFALQIEPARERTHRRLMRLYYHCGLRTAALHQYQRCGMILKKELDVEPAHSTNMLYELIRRDALPRPAAETMHLWAAFAHSQRIQHSLQSAHRLLLQAQQQIALAESILASNQSVNP